MSDNSKTKEFADQLKILFEGTGLDISDIESFEIRDVPEPIVPAKALEAYEAVKTYFQSLDKLSRAAMAFEAMFNKKEKQPIYTDKLFKNEFFGCDNTDRIYRLQETLSPVGVALITLQEFFDQSGRFDFIDPRLLPYYKKLIMPILYEEPIWVPVSLGSNQFTVPDQRDLWVNDKKTHRRHVIQYNVMGGGLLKIQIESAWEQGSAGLALLAEIKEAILTSRHFRGQILELNPRGFSILDLPEQSMPIIDKSLQLELEKNVINMFQKESEFRAYGLPTKRAIILEGLPGCGKTLTARYLAYTLKGKVTVLWVTAKAISSSQDIAQIFDMARKLSPVLLILEDLDLISGTRAHDADCLGEMLNQLDGTQPNESLVLVASTNQVKSLDVALRDRPGRFDRIYQIGKPSSELAEQIARRYLKEHGVKEPVVGSLSFASVSKGDLTGAQIVEVVKGGIFEAIHRGCEINDICLSASYRGLVDQRTWMGED